MYHRVYFHDKFEIIKVLENNKATYMEVPKMSRQSMLFVS